MPGYRTFFSIIEKSYSGFWNAALCTLLLCIFSFTIHYAFPLKLVALGSLATAAFLLSASLSNFSLPLRKKGVSRISPVYYAIGAMLGLVIATFYRLYLGTTLLPQSIHLFVIVAALIGTSEEIVFRGIIQNQAKSISRSFSIFFGTFSHTAYKSCLFLSPAATSDVDVVNLAFWTFLFGIVLGYIKDRSGSIVPPVIAHAIFDILAYAEFMNPPWWVW